VNPEDRGIYRARYVERLAEFGHDPRALGWSKGKQVERFTALTSRVDLSRAQSVLDVGCGFGDLCPFLREHGFRGSYLGVDFIEELLEVGRKAYPDAELRNADIDDFDSTERFDLVVASGIFNGVLEHEEQWARIERTLSRMHELAGIACAADFMSRYVDYTRDDTFYAEPERVLTLAKKLSRRVVLDHSYLPFEFAVWLFREDGVQDGARFSPLSLE
jgi:2-polyprenyl-3-methyl-5-hydroxy-6-metoxy-1,4-benzoquinol methylase